MAEDKHLSIAPSALRQVDLNQPLSAAASVKWSSAGIAASCADRRPHSLATADPQLGPAPLPLVKQLTAEKG
jgi:hypothetical protein